MKNTVIKILLTLLLQLRYKDNIKFYIFVLFRQVAELLHDETLNDNILTLLLFFSFSERLEGGNLKCFFNF